GPSKRQRPRMLGAEACARQVYHNQTEPARRAQRVRRGFYLLAMSAARMVVAQLLLVLCCAGAEPRLAIPRKVWAESGTNILGAPSPDGRFLSYVDAATGDLAIRDLGSGAGRRLTHNKENTRGQFAYFSVISPDNKRVAYAWFNDEKFYDLRVTSVD